MPEAFGLFKDRTNQKGVSTREAALILRTYIQPLPFLLALCYSYIKVLLRF
jgi:hypothetical protein